MSQWVSGAHIAFLQNSAGHTLRGPKLQGAQIEWSKTLRGKFAFNLCPAEFWTPQSVPRGVLDLLMCAPWSFWAMQHSPSFLMETKLRGPKYPQKPFKNLTFLFLQGYFCNPLSFQWSIQPIWPFFKQDSSWDRTFKWHSEYMYSLWRVNVV